MAQKNKKSPPSNRLALSAAVAAALLSGYVSRQAFAGSCTGAAGTYTCSGAVSVLDTTQNLNSGAIPLTVTTTNGFGIDTSVGDAFHLITGPSGVALSFTDNFSSSITGDSSGVLAQNFGSGALSITTTGAVTGKSFYGIYASNYDASIGLTINAASVSGKFRGVTARNSGSGALSITTTDVVTGTNYDGIRASNYGADLTINAASVSGGTSGVYSRNFGGGALSITTSGVVTGTSRYGIFARNFGTDLTINAASSVSGGTGGIYAGNFGGGALSITTSGAVTGTSFIGIFARNHGTDLTINAASSVSGEYNGVFARNYGNGKLSITTTGAVRATNYDGIYAHNLGTDLTINVASVSGGFNGVYARNSGTGVTSISISGAVTGGAFRAGIGNYSLNASSITLNSGAAVSAASGIAITQSGTGTKTVTVNSGASVTGSILSSGGANTTILNGGSLNVATGFALTVDGDVVNSTGSINLQNNRIDAPATINGNFTGGGQLLLDANFATNMADKLNITGNVLAGGTQVSLNDISTGPATGAAIALISVGGTTTSGDFSLAGPVVNGAFNYNTLALVGKDWILQSASATGGPVFTPVASSFEVLAQSLLTLETLPSLTDRTRNQITGANSGDETGIDSLLWLRVTGGYRDIDSNRSTTGANFDTNHWKAQIGVDSTVANTASGRFVAGLNVGYNQADTDVKATAGKSNIDTTGYSLGLTGTWYGLNGVYIDTQVQRSWYKSDLSAGGVGGGNIDDVDGDGYSASVEIGKDIALNDGLSITPQAQLIYAMVDTDTFTGTNAEVVKLTKSKSLKARIGAALTKRFSEDGATQGYVIANVIHEFEDETHVNISSAQLVNAVDKWSGELGLGMSHGWSTGTTSYQLSASMTGNTSLNNVGDSNAMLGKVVFKVNF